MLNKKSVFATLFLVLITFVSCGDAYSPFAEMNFVKEYGWTDSSQIMASPIADTNNPEAIAELSSQVVICEISALDRAIVNGIGDLHFYYTATIKEILYDRDLRQHRINWQMKLATKNSTAKAQLHPLTSLPKAH